ncbi:putative Ser/Thr protein kinase [Granulicella aggregans]|uniref:Putative Ser/Thr protein kinase n=1 Tax=Granulicella aggregans TaxID=474949 RepID=A0A7W7ZCM9_9BACT|nr:putative Ser/Thr protein kinase [Granulicella aggregans]
MDLDRYKTIELIGEGGMSTVYRGEDVRIGRPVAIKLLKASDAGNNLDLGARFLREATITGQLQHPSIVTLFDFGTTAENQAYIVMEFVDGKSLRHHQGKLTTLQLGKILRGTALGLDYAHTRGVIHRDVKPSNIILAQDGNPKILDFGIAVIQQTSGSRMTQTGVVIGTPAYLSPEQISGGAITPAVDQFALAVVAFELLTGKAPFAGETFVETMSAIMVQQPIDPLSLNPKLGPGCTTVLHKALSKKPSERFATCSEFVEALLKVLGHGPKALPFLAGAPPRTLGPSEGGTVVPRSAQREDLPNTVMTRLNLPMTVGLSVMGQGSTPTGYSFTQVVGTTGPFFGSGEAHFLQIKKKLDFYQEQLHKEYEALLQQMRTTYLLWLVAVSMAFLVLLSGIILFLLHQTTGGAITTASSAMLYFLQRVFQRREDEYRQAAEAKRSTVEYGNQWALVIQTIQGMEDPKERVTREGRLVEALIDHLSRSKSSAPERRVRRGSAAKPNRSAEP